MKKTLLLVTATASAALGLGLVFTTPGKDSPVGSNQAVAAVTCPTTGYYTKDCVELPQTRVIGGNQWCSVVYSGKEINEGPCDAFKDQTLAELKLESDKYDKFYGSESTFAEAKSESLNKTINANVEKGCYFDEKTGERKGGWSC